MGFKMTSGIRMPKSDDIIITTQSHIQTRWVLGIREETASRAIMKFKPRKYLVLRKGKILP